MAGGLEQGSWGLGRVSKGLGGWGLERAEVLGLGGAGPSGDVRTDVRSLVRTYGRTENSPLCPIGHRPLRVRCPKGRKKKKKKEKGRKRKKKKEKKKQVDLKSLFV